MHSRFDIIVVRCSLFGGGCSHEVKLQADHGNFLDELAYWLEEAAAVFARKPIPKPEWNRRLAREELV